MDLREQNEQDLEYEFPYHYIPEYSDGFLASKSWSWSVNYISAIEAVVSEVKEQNDGNNQIIDVGCGDGRLTRELAREIGPDKVQGIDYSVRAINLAKALNPGVNFEVLDILSQEQNKEYDIATLIEVFEHIPIDQADDFVTALVKLLKPNGVLLMTVPHENKPLSYKHFQHFNKKKIERYFSDNFEIEFVEYIQKQSRLLLVISALIINRFYVINNALVNRLYYRVYKKFFYKANASNAGRIFVRMRVKK